jgi:hypothetical protein
VEDELDSDSDDDGEVDPDDDGEVELEQEYQFTADVVRECTSNLLLPEKDLTVFIRDNFSCDLCSYRVQEASLKTVKVGFAWCSLFFVGARKPERVQQVHGLIPPANRPSFSFLSVKTDSSPRPEVRIWKLESTTTKE